MGTSSTTTAATVAPTSTWKSSAAPGSPQSPLITMESFYRLKGASSQVHCYQRPHLPLFFGGASEIALDVGSRRADVFCLVGANPGRPYENGWPTSVAAPVNGVATSSSACRCVLSWGKTEGKAWQRAEEILARVQNATKGSIVPGQPARLQSVGSRRLLEFAAQGDLHDERLWMPVAAASGAAGSTTCLVGTPRQVAESLLAYYDLGCTTFIIRGFDPLNDAHEYGRELIPLLREMVAGRVFKSQLTGTAR